MKKIHKTDEGNNKMSEHIGTIRPVGPAPIHNSLDSIKRPNLMTFAIIGVGLVGIAFYVHRRILNMQGEIAKLGDATMKTVKHVSEMSVYGQQIQELSALIKAQKNNSKVASENTTILYEEINDVRSNLQTLVDQLSNSKDSNLTINIPRRKTRKLLSSKRPEKKSKRRYDSEDDESEELDSSDDEDVSRTLSRAKRN